MHDEVCFWGILPINSVRMTLPHIPPNRGLYIRLWETDAHADPWNVLYFTSMEPGKPASKPSVATEIFTVLRSEILSGKYSCADKFPSEQQLVRRFKVARTTVRLALNRLKEDGILETRNGSGTYLSAMANRVTGRLGLIIPHIAHGEISPPICSAIAQAASDAGYSLLFGDASSADPDVRAQRALSLARDYIAQGVAGVFLEPIELIHDPSSVTLPIIRLFEAHHIPVILLDRDIVFPPERSPYDLVTLDNVQIGYRLAAHLVERGARQICLFARPESAPTVKLRFQGAREALLDAGFGPSRFSTCLASPDDKDALARVLGGKHAPDAFLCANDITAFALIKTLGKLKRKVPRDILVTGIDDVRLAAISTPSLTTIHQPCGEIARAAVAAMLQRLRNPALPPRQILLDAQLVERASTRRR